MAARSHQTPRSPASLRASSRRSKPATCPAPAPWHRGFGAGPLPSFESARRKANHPPGLAVTDRRHLGVPNCARTRSRPSRRPRRPGRAVAQPLAPVSALRWPLAGSRGLRATRQDAPQRPAGWVPASNPPPPSRRRLHPATGSSGQGAAWRVFSPARRRPRRVQRYCAAVMNSRKVSHQTTTARYCDRSTPGASGSMKLSKVFTSPTRSMRGLTRSNAASSSTNSGER